MTDEYKEREPLNERERARALFDRIHRSPRIPDRYAERRAVSR